MRKKVTTIVIEKEYSDKLKTALDRYNERTQPKKKWTKSSWVSLNIDAFYKNEVGK